MALSVGSLVKSDPSKAALREERRTNGTTILIVEQNLPFAVGIADSWAVLKLGRIDDAGDVTAGTAARVLQHLKI
ncbi:hypothetical protein [Mesorhizobium sp. f-mel]